MDTPYLIEIRIRGDIRDLCKKLIFDIYHKFRVRGMVRKRPVPHITLFGPFGCRSIKNVIETIKEVGQDYVTSVLDESFEDSDDIEPEPLPKTEGRVTKISYDGKTWIDIPELQNIRITQ
ncbi:MAG: hypothetical protein ACW9W3_05825 [Candidatus Nitrosopumilus sp. bin_68KS]